MSERLNVDWRDGAGRYHVLIQRACAFLIAVDRRRFAIMESGETKSQGAVVGMEVDGIPMVVRMATNQKRLAREDASRRCPFVKSFSSNASCREPRFLGPSGCGSDRGHCDVAEKVRCSASPVPVHLSDAKHQQGTDFKDADNTCPDAAYTPFTTRSKTTA